MFYDPSYVGNLISAFYVFPKSRLNIWKFMIHIMLKHKLESRSLGEISITSDMQMTPPLWQKAKKNLKSLLMKVKEESEKVA